jgi:hypothetical protein
LDILKFLLGNNWRKHFRFLFKIHSTAILVQEVGNLHITFLKKTSIFAEKIVKIAKNYARNVDICIGQQCLLQVLRLRGVPPLPADQQPDVAEQAEEARQEGQVELHAHHQEAGQLPAF